MESRIKIDLILAWIFEKFFLKYQLQWKFLEWVGRLPSGYEQSISRFAIKLLHFASMPSPSNADGSGRLAQATEHARRGDQTPKETLINSSDLVPCGGLTRDNVAFERCDHRDVHLIAPHVRSAASL